MSRSLALALLAIPVAAIAAPATTLDQVSAHLKAVDTMTARFVQTASNGRSVGGTLTLILFAVMLTSRIEDIRTSNTAIGRGTAFGVVSIVLFAPS